jgi:hypothetical protein
MASPTSLRLFSQALATTRIHISIVVFINSSSSSWLCVNTKNKKPICFKIKTHKTTNTHNAPLPLQCSSIKLPQFSSLEKKQSSVTPLSLVLIEK